MMLDLLQVLSILLLIFCFYNQAFFCYNLSHILYCAIKCYSVLTAQGNFVLVLHTKIQPSAGLVNKYLLAEGLKKTVAIVWIWNAIHCGRKGTVALKSEGVLVICLALLVSSCRVRAKVLEVFLRTSFSDNWQFGIYKSYKERFLSLGTLAEIREEPPLMCSPSHHSNLAQGLLGSLAP